MSLLLVIIAISCPAQLVINEVCSKNEDLITDGFGDHTDWVELHNNGAVTIDLQGHFLSDDPTQLTKWQLPPQTLAPGGFILLFAEKDQNSPVHFSFRIPQEGETIHLSDAMGNVIDQVDVPFLQVDHSYGTFQEMIGQHYLYGAPTPGSSNSTTAYLDYTSPPQFDPPPHITSSSTQVQLYPTPGSTVHYTTDGIPADQTANAYSSPINVSTSTTISAMALQDSMLPSQVVVGSYLVQPRNDLPVITISCHPDSLFDDTLGLYMHGPDADPNYPHWGANFWSEREIPVHMEYYSKNGVRRLSQSAGLRIHGGRASRNKPQRPFRLTARDRYGDDRFRYPIFTERADVAKYKRLVLRNSGADHCLSNIRDGFWHQLAFDEGLNIDALAFQPSEVYVNGEYWGMMHIRERFDEDHLSDVYGAVDRDILLMEEEDIPFQGDSLHFDSLYHYVVDNDLSIASHYQWVSDRIDVASMHDYFAFEIFAGNADWPANNLKFWKPSITEGKWRYLMYDLDATIMSLGWIPMDIDVHKRIFDNYGFSIHSQIFGGMLENAEYRRTYINRFADLLNTSFQPEVLHALHARIVDELGAVRTAHWDRWCPGDEWRWELHSGELFPEFFSIRQGIVRDQIQSNFTLEDQVTLDIDVFPANSGTVQINTITPAMPFTGVYFDGNPIDVSVTATPGFVFDRWEIGSTESTKQPAWQRNFSSHQRLVAYFRRDKQGLQAYPSPFTGPVELALETPVAGAVEVQISDLSGRTVHSSQHFAQLGMNRIQLDLSALRPGIYLAVVIGKDVHEVERLQRQ